MMELSTHWLPYCYVLSVDEAHGLRRESSRRQLDAMNIDWEFVDGFRRSDPDLYSEYSSRHNLLLMKRSMTAGEIAAYRGHRKIWQKILDNKHDVALVLEDDFSIHDRATFLTNLQDAYGVGDRWDIVKFFDFSPKACIESRQFNQTKFAIYKHPSSGAVAYLICREAAERLLKRPKIYRPIDEDLSHPWEAGLRIFSVLPNPVSEQSERLGGSLLEQERKSIRVQHRNIARSVYGNLLTLHKKFHSKGWSEEMKKQLLRNSP